MCTVHTWTFRYCIHYERRGKTEHCGRQRDYCIYPYINNRKKRNPVKRKCTDCMNFPRYENDGKAHILAGRTERWIY